MNEGEEGRVGILMCAGCAFVCLLLVVSIALTEVAMQDRRLVSCADALASAGVSGASASTVFAGGNLGVDEETASSRVDRALAGLSDSTCRVGDGVNACAGCRGHPKVASATVTLWDGEGRSGKRNVNFRP